MKEATGEVSMTVVTLVAIAVIGAILATQWGSIQNKINGLWNSGESNTQWCPAGQTWNGSQCV